MKKRMHRPIVLIILLILSAMPLASQEPDKPDFWAGVRATISTIIHGAADNAAAFSLPETAPLSFINLRAGSAAEPLSSVNRGIAASTTQSCEARASYITTPGVVPVTIEWSLVGVNIDSVEWIFHDGSTSSQPVTQFTYTTIGTYPVVLKCNGPLGQLTINNSVVISGSSSSGTQVATPTITMPTMPSTNTPVPAEDTPDITPIPTLTITPGPSPTPIDTATPRPTSTPTLTHTPGPSPTATLTSTPQPATATSTVTDCIIGVIPDLDDPLTFTFYLEEVINVETVVWAIEGTLTAGSSVTTTFTEIGIKIVEVECSGLGGTVRRTIVLQVMSGTAIILGAAQTLTIVSTPPAPPPQQPQPQPSQVPTIIKPAVPQAPANRQPRGTTENWVPIEAGEGVCVDWIAYHSNREREINIFRLGDLPAGQTGDANLSRSSGEGIYSLSATISPDRRWVAFSSNRDGNMEIYISAVTHDEIRQVTSTPGAGAFNPVWSPDGSYLVFETSRDGNWELYLVDLLAGAINRLTWDDGQDIDASWSADSARIIFQSSRDGFWQIYELTVDTLDVRRLTQSEANDYDPVYSHSGQQIAFRSTRDEADGNALYVMDAEGANVQRISGVAPFVGGLTWSPDDTLLAYQSDLTGISQIYVYAPLSGETRQVTGDATSVNSIASFAPTWLCDSSDTVIFTAATGADLSDVFSTTTRPLTAPAINVAREAVNLTASVFEDGYAEGLSSSNGGLGREVHTGFSHRYQRAQQVRYPAS